MQLSKPKINSLKIKEDKELSISFYNNLPNFEFTIDDFELISLERLQLLRKIDSLKSKGYDPKQLRDTARIV